MSTKTYRVFCLSEAVSPITHMSGSSGNESLVMREPVITDKGVVYVPCVTGNSLRHRAVREPGWRYLIDHYGLAGKLTLPQLNFAFHGGNLTEGGGRENLNRIADMQRIFPLSRLIGGCLPDQILSGSLDVHRGRLVCEENRSALASDLPSGWELPAESLRSSESFVSGYQYTRSDAEKTHISLLPESVVDGELLRGENHNGKSNLMIFSGQAVTQGACFLHGFLLKHVGRVNLGALLWSLQLWQESGGTIGGQAARGHGRLKTWIHTDDADGAIDEYLAHVDGVKDAAIAWLTDAFAARVEKPKKPKKEAVA